MAGAEATAAVAAAIEGANGPTDPRTKEALMPDVNPELDALLARIEKVLDERIRPGLRSDGGDVDVVGIDADRIVQVRMKGACQGCSSSLMTLAFGIEAALK